MEAILYILLYLLAAAIAYKPIMRKIDKWTAEYKKPQQIRPQYEGYDSKGRLTKL